ncbi:aspartate ammonia-lyase [Candidatus Peregrinibacteria bacterium CG_4_10_14_0_2_um_filter_43_11]|nr:MAG: aspartate ammonia-lyase [Candidatus Peregrinibacteria bacterium CG_4_10_14_0_2_um_filter_43_11]
MQTRLEHDFLGSKAIPKNALYGIHTFRTMENFSISGISLLPEMVVAYAHLKKACAQANHSFGLLPEKITTPLLRACDEIIDGKHMDQFLMDVFQAGAGTSTNMNLNEVIANRALEIMGEEKGNYKVVSPNDHVNMAQSTNDTYPSAMRVAIVIRFDGLDRSLEHLQRSFQKKAVQFKKVIKAARTHLQDATPITLGQEFSAYSKTIVGLRKQLARARDSIAVLGIGGSAVGTGLNVHSGYPKRVVRYLNKNTKFCFKSALDLVESMQSQRQMLEFSSCLKQIAVEVSRIASDLRLLSSGPNTGFAELILPAVQPGSSMMPGKVNPSILECVNMVCYRVMGSEATVLHCVHGGQLDLNVNMPLMSYEVLTSMTILKNVITMMSEKCIEGIEANKKQCEKYVYLSASLATSLNPIIGYSKVAEIVQEFVTTGKPLPEIILKKNILTKKEVEELLNPLKMIRS